MSTQAQGAGVKGDSIDGGLSAQARIDSWLSDRQMEGLRLSQQTTTPQRLSQQTTTPQRRPAQNLAQTLTRLPTSVARWAIPDERGGGSDVLDDIRAARKEIRAAAAVDGTSAVAIVRALGGAERAATLLNLASLDEDGDGNLSPHEVDRYKAIGAALVESAKNFHLNAGVVAALVFSVIYSLAFEEKHSLKDLATAASWDNMWIVSELTSCVAMQLAVSSSIITVLVSSRLYTQLAFWMPDLDSQIWFINESAPITGYLETCKNVTLFVTLLALTLETAVTGSLLDIIAYLPLVLTGWVYFHMESFLADKCRNKLGRPLLKLGRSPSVRPCVPGPLNSATFAAGCSLKGTALH